MPRFSVYRVSKTEKNKDRSFFACTLSKEKGGCGFFAWSDDVILDDKTGLAKKRYIPLPEGYVKKPKVSEEKASQLEERCHQIEERIKFLEEKYEQLRPTKLQKNEINRSTARK